VEFVKELLRTVWRKGIALAMLAPRTVIDDNVGFRRAK
jgi:hypothetical protein